MTPKQRAVAALTLQIPDMVPAFELGFQLEGEMFGRKFITGELRPESLSRMGRKEKEKAIHGLAEYMVRVYGSLEHSIIPVPILVDLDCLWKEGILPEEMRLLCRHLRSLASGEYMLAIDGDGTYAIPDGNGLYEFSYALADDPAGVKARAEELALEAIRRNAALREAGIECLLLCSDYCFNSGPFISPAMFAEFIQPYLYKIIDEARREGFYTIKHTDGNIMPILDQLVECRPHGLHSLDPGAGVDIREVKRRVGSSVCLCGNVSCAALHTGTDEEVIAGAEYCMTHGKPGGGYLFCTSNLPFEGIAPERYRLMQEVWRKTRAYG